MAHLLIDPEPPRTILIDGKTITARKVKLLDPRRTIYRFELGSGFSLKIPPTENAIIVKQQKIGWEKELQDERKAYENLKELQGKLIPTLYGEGIYDGYPALLLSDEAGSTLYDLARNLHVRIFYNALEVMLEEVFVKLTSHCAVYWDQRADNFLFNEKDGKITVLDLEEVRFPGEFGEADHLVNQGGASTILDEVKAARKSSILRISDQEGDT
nr:hypothetical protein [Penicillium meliponae]